MYLLFIHGIIQLYVCVALNMEPFRMSMMSEINDFRTFYVFAIEIVVSVLVIMLIDFIKKLRMKRKLNRIENAQKKLIDKSISLCYN